jgi:hypothetical protein
VPTSWQVLDEQHHRRRDKREPAPETIDLTETDQPAERR